MAKSIGLHFSVVLTEENISASYKKALNDPTIKHALGQSMVNRGMRAFDQQGWETRNAWRAKLVPSVAGIFADLNEGKDPPKRRFQTRPVLEDSGALQNSLAYEITKEAIVYGSPLPYAKLQNDGGVSNQVKTRSDFNRRLYKWMKKNKKAPFAKYFKQIGFLYRIKQMKTKLTARPFIGLDLPELESAFQKAVLASVQKYGRT